MKLSKEQIEAKTTPKGGYSKAQLALWGVPWPPPKGWKKALIAGEPILVPRKDLENYQIELGLELRKLL